MTNTQIIANEAIAHNLYSEEEVEKLLSEFGGLPLFTFAEWKKRGYSVRKGEKASLTCYIWRLKKGAKTVTDKSGNDVEIDDSNFYKAKAHFFTPDQVDKIENVA